MRLGDLNKELFELLPDFQIAEDNYGQLVVYTGLMKGDYRVNDPELVEFEYDDGKEDEIGPHVWKGDSIVDDCKLCGQRYAHENHR